MTNVALQEQASRLAKWTKQDPSPLGRDRVRTPMGMRIVLNNKAESL